MKSEFLAAIKLLSTERGVPPQVVVEALESALVAAYRRNSIEPPNVGAHIDPNTGEARVRVGKTVVAGPAGPEEITLEQAQRIEPNAAVGDIVWEEVAPGSLGRIAAQAVKQHIAQKLREAERKRVFDEFSGFVGEILHGLVQRIEQRTVILELGKVDAARAEAIMPPPEQMATERYYPGQRLRVYLVDVLDTHKGPQLLVSRAHRFMIKRLFEQEVPEIFNGTVEIKAIAREPGARSKVAVTAREEGIDPIGACVGMRGVRIQNIVDELSGEKVDVIPWHADAAAFVAAALSPAQVLQVTIREEDKTAVVVVPERQLSLAIGREGQNARLAARLTGWRIDIKSDVVAAAAGIWTSPGAALPEIPAPEPPDVAPKAEETRSRATAATSAASEADTATPELSPQPAPKAPRKRASKPSEQTVPSPEAAPAESL